MSTPESRLNAAIPCGVSREGYQLTMVRLDDVQSLCGAAHLFEREGAAAREKVQAITTENADLKIELAALRKGVASAIQTLEGAACSIR